MFQIEKNEKRPDESFNQIEDYYKDGSKTTLYPLKTKSVNLQKTRFSIY